ncbi:sigma-B regulation protein RsbU (phosphoserine phosphatase) [Pseudoxanthomonas japonensis]|uniref:SpoIIE family protein phosphatase n=1 Tax=Pseudoxanthomonas japonensis TaxID=69284 RepID=UPI00285DD025|nr:SpoIIE family protein phosphatase [Pseudoxanthomonas japonensis]MDR7068392.1 sigma-B regulation protein RsbU (phosphoserine phosphatase) [Pseudoxanthomonas japonensis]
MRNAVPSSVVPVKDAAGAAHWRSSLRTRIALWAGLINVVLLLLLVLATAWFARRMILEDARRDTHATTQEAAHRLDGALHVVTITTHGISDLVGSAQLSPDELVATLRAMVKATPGCAGGLLVLEPRERGDAPFARYVAAAGNDRDFVADGYPFRDQGWYQRTVASPGGWWSEPYLNQTAGGVWMVTYNMPLREPGRGARTRGMVSLDLPLANMTDPVDSLAHLPGWRVTLVAPGGTLALNPEVGIEQRETLDEYIVRAGRTDLRQAAQAVRMRQPLQYVHADAVSGERRYTVVEPVGDSGWALLVAQSYDLITDRLAQALWLVVAIGTLLALVCMLVVRRLAQYISQPVEGLSSAAARLAHGDYEMPVPHVHRADEVGQMARTLEHARGSIRQQLREIEDMTAARQKLESELSIAREIQQAMLPPGLMIDREHAHLEAYARLEPAKAVGGDFYCFIQTDPDCLWFAIGDVSDKGVPAALFMARTVTVLEVAASAHPSPERVLAEASRRLVQGNDACMFATVLCGRVDVRSGACVLASAGHDAPLLLHADGRYEELPVQPGPPLGFEVGEAFPLWSGQLPAGATLLAWTDGITEAFDRDNHAFGAERIPEALQPGATAREQCETLIARVHAFTDPAPQSDDITALAIRRRLDSTPASPEAPPTQETAHADATVHPA